MWYFTWVLGLTAALSIGIINALWYEASHAFDPKSDD
jgi:cytochrome bd-I ubiquinol oxidase subunit X